MSWFSKKPNNIRQLASQEQLALGGLPLNAQDRLREIKASDSSFFTSNLSVNEFALAADQKIKPLGQVMGSTIYQLGTLSTPYYRSGEMMMWGEAQWEARKLALGRLQQEAALLGAHGVIGVRLEQKSQEWGQNLLEFTARGTAVAIGMGPVPKQPFICSLNGQEFWALHCSGYRPVGIAFGACAYYQVASRQTQYMRAYMGTVELTEFSSAVYKARRGAMSRLQAEAARVTAEGVVGVSVGTETRSCVDESCDPPRRDLIAQFTAIGTAIKSQTGAVPSINYSLALNG